MKLLQHVGRDAKLSPPVVLVDSKGLEHEGHLGHGRVVFFPLSRQRAGTDDFSRVYIEELVHGRVVIFQPEAELLKILLMNEI